MTAPIGPGDYVECVADWPAYGLPRGSVWMVEEVIPTEPGMTCFLADDCQEPGILLKGYKVPVSAECCCACGFRPIYRPKGDFIESLKAPPKVVPIRECEAA